MRKVTYIQPVLSISQEHVVVYTSLNAAAIRMNNRIQSGPKKCIHSLLIFHVKCVYIFWATLCVCVCVCVYIYIYIYICVCL